MFLTNLFRAIRAAVADWLRCLRSVAAGIALFTASTLVAQMVSIPLGGPRPERPSPNAALLGAPAAIGDAVAAKGRPAAMRRLDESNHPVEVLEYLGLARGLRVLVVEHDTGYFGEIVAAAVGPGGRVVELVRPAEMQDPAIRAILSDDISLAPNLALLAAAPATVRLAPGSFDFVLLHLTDDLLSPATEPGVRRANVSAFLDKLFISVRPGGVVGIVADAAQGTGDRRDVTVATDVTGIKRDFARAGFLLDSEGRVRDAGGNGFQPAEVGDMAALPKRFIVRFRKSE